MSWVDTASFIVQSGKGGAGAVSFRREKFVDRGGPDGGDGGDGGGVYFLASSSIQTLRDFRVRREYKAENGLAGSSKNCSGLQGKSITLRVPVGTLVYHEDESLLVDLSEDGQKVLILSGGRGGKGNKYFANSVNRAPRYAQPGLSGGTLLLRLELRLIADLGIVGFPNAGKSTLLNVLTRSNAKVADYPFTTLFPNLGTLNFDDREIILADIPGILEGASEGIGLGLDFLRHIDRTRLLLFLIEASGSPQSCYETFLTLKQELSSSRYMLSEKPSLLAISKADLIDDLSKEAINDFFSKEGIKPLFISSATHQGLNCLRNCVRARYDALE